MKKLLFILLLPLTLFGQKEVIIHITTDNYPNETKWTLYKDSYPNGDVLGSVPYGHYTQANTSYMDTLYIADTITDIAWVIFDSWGDGMPGGSYYVSICGDTIVSYPVPTFTTGLIHNRVVPQCMPNPPPCVPATVVINLDQYQGETSWDIKDTSGTIYAASVAYNGHPDYATIIIPVCIPKGPLEFTIYDTYGDGLNGALWQGQDGSYYLTQCNDTLVYGNVPNFGFDTTHTFVSDSCPPILGCTDTNYVEFNPFANVDDGSCSILKVFGCIDSTMFNYDSLANTMSMISSCDYTLILHDLMGNGWVGSSLKLYAEDTTEYHHTGGFDDIYTVNLKAPRLINLQFFISAQASLTTIECGFTLINPEGDTAISIQPPFIQPLFVYNAITNCGNTCIEKVFGCTDPLAVNYDSLANTEDSSCYYTPGCMNSSYLEYYTQGFTADYDDGTCQTLAVWGCTDSAAFNYNSLANIDNGGCLPIITGCMQPLAFNYNPNANTPDTCIPILYGCMSSIAINYDSLANTDDGSCIGVIYGCTDSSAFNYSPSANADDGSCVPIVYGCMDPSMFNYDVLANTDNNSCIPFIYGCMDTLAFNYNPLANTDNNSCIPVVYGCTNPSALNYNPLANTDDLSCIGTIYGCTDSTAFNYNPLANFDNGSCLPIIMGCTDPSALNYNPLANTNDFSCILPIYGCMDSLAFNYSPFANIDNGSCVPVILGCTDPIALNYCDSCNTDDFSCILPIYGCTDSTMFNFNPLANVDNNSCIPYIYGCTDPSMLNYNPSANTENFSCIPYIYGCTDSIALNYDSTANTDNGSCITVVEGCMDQSAYNYDVTANVNDSASCLYSANCITGPGSPYWLNDPCYAWVIDVDEYCCENEWDTICQLTYNHCEDGWAGDLPPARILGEDISIYPNPTTGIFYISKFVEIEVYDNIGRLVLSGKGNMIDLSPFDKGIYSTVIKYNNQTINKKIIKN
tara:strand:- start:315 stop:3224 length:2910 start_codon:yes stop_codon:yes gene_type:complete